VLLALSDKFLEFGSLDLILAEFALVPFVDTAFFLGLLLCVILVALLCYLVDELERVKQDVFFPLAELFISDDVALRLRLDLLDLPEMDFLFQRSQPLRKAHFVPRDLLGVLIWLLAIRT